MVEGACMAMISMSDIDDNDMSDGISVQNQMLGDDQEVVIEKTDKVVNELMNKNTTKVVEKNVQHVKEDILPLQSPTMSHNEIVNFANAQLDHLKKLRNEKHQAKVLNMTREEERREAHRLSMQTQRSQDYKFTPSPQPHSERKESNRLSHQKQRDQKYDTGIPGIQWPKIDANPHLSLLRFHSLNKPGKCTTNHTNKNFPN
jgi:hypothetical protein